MKSTSKSLLLVVILIFLVTGQGYAQNRGVSGERAQVHRNIPSAGNVINRSRVNYKRNTTRVVAQRTLPKNAVVINHNGLKYHYAEGRYYRYYGGRYILVAPRIGLHLSALPFGYYTFMMGPVPYYYFDGIYYIDSDDGYEVVQPEVGMIVDELPENYEKVIIDDQVYYEFNNVLYKKIHTDEGRAYEVVGIIE